MSEEVKGDEAKAAVAAKVKFFREQVQLICTKCPEATMVEVAPGRMEAKCKHWYATCCNYPNLARALPVGEPYTITEYQYRLGKSYCRHDYNPEATIEVIDICYVPVSKKLVDEYVNHVVDRLRGLRRILSPLRGGECFCGCMNWKNSAGSSTLQLQPMPGLTCGKHRRKRLRSSMHWKDTSRDGHYNSGCADGSRNQKDW